MQYETPTDPGRSVAWGFPACLRPLTSLGTMGIRTILLVAASCAMLATPSLAKGGNPAVSKDRIAAATTARPAVLKKVREAKRSSRVAVIATDVRQKRYLALGDDLDAQPGGVLTRRTIGGDAISDGP